MIALLLSAAYGISEYQPNIDRNMQDVIERGDQNMYLNKTQMKLDMGISPNVR